MERRQAIELFVQREFSAIPTEWVRVIEEDAGGCSALPMWGDMWIVSDFLGERLWDASKAQDDDAELSGERRVAETAMYIYWIGEYYVVGIHGAGWNFYDGVWDEIYDALDIQWHNTER